MQQARALGANGIQAGTIFALCAESGLTPDLRREMLSELGEGRLSVRTDALASPTRFPFKVVSIPGTLADADLYSTRSRVCDLGHLRQGGAQEVPLATLGTDLTGPRHLLRRRPAGWSAAQAVDYLTP